MEDIHAIQFQLLYLLEIVRAVIIFFNLKMTTFKNSCEVQALS